LERWRNEEVIDGEAEVRIENSLRVQAQLEISEFIVVVTTSFSANSVRGGSRAVAAEL